MRSACGHGRARGELLAARPWQAQPFWVYSLGYKFFSILSGHRLHGIPILVFHLLAAELVFKFRGANRIVMLAVQPQEIPERPQREILDGNIADPMLVQIGGAIS